MEKAAESGTGAEAGQTATDPTGKAQVGVSQCCSILFAERVGSLAHTRAEWFHGGEIGSPRQRPIKRVTFASRVRGMVF